jgi:hypothetical protein
MGLLGDLASGIAGDTVEKLILFMASWLVEIFTTMLDLVGTWWLNIDAPEMGAGTASERVQTATTTFVGVAGIIGTAFAALRIARDHNRESAENLVMGLIRTVVISALAVSGVALSLAVTDEVAPWLVDTIAGDAAQDGLGQSMGLGTIAAAGMALPTAGMLILLAPFAMIGAFLNAALVIFSYGVAGALCGILPIFAAASTTPKGQKAFDKAVGWLIAMILFKPTAAVIYGFGLALMNGISGTAGDDVSNKIISLITGIVIIFSACLTMPALVRVLVPAVSAGPRGMGAGGMVMLAGGLAIGAMTAGVGTAAAGAATAGAGATGAGAGGAGGAGAGGAAGAGAGGAGATGALGSGSLGGGSRGFSGAGAPGGSSVQNANGAQPSGGGTGEGTPSSGGPAGAPNVESASTGAAPASAPGNTSGGASGAQNVETPSTGAAPASAPGSTSGGASGAQNVQSPTTGAAPGSATGTGTGGASGAEQVQSSSPSPATADGASETSGPAGAEPVAATSGAGPTGHPGGEGSSATGAKKSFIDGHRLEFGLREVVRDAEHSMESGEDL